MSCNTTSIVRALGALKRSGLLRRATDPWESHLGGIMNTVLPEPAIPSHQGPDARNVDPEFDVVTMAVAVPTTIAHVHYRAVNLTRSASKEDVLQAFAGSSRIAPINGGTGLAAPNVVKELIVDNQAIVIPEMIDTIRALTGSRVPAGESIALTDIALWMGMPFAANSPPLAPLA